MSSHSAHVTSSITRSANQNIRDLPPSLFITPLAVSLALTSLPSHTTCYDEGDVASRVDTVCVHESCWATFSVATLIRLHEA